MSQDDRTRRGATVPVVLAACTAVSILSTDLVAPSIPDLPEIFGTDIRTAQAVVAVNLLAYALAQLLHGPISDAIGRRRLLVRALVAFAAVSLVCAFAGSITFLLAGRFLQGLFSSVPSVVVVLIIRELYPGAAAVRVMALYGLAIGAAPALGPLIGGYLHVWLGWRAGFVLVAFLALLVAAAVVWRVPETRPGRRPLAPRAALSAYAGLFANGDFVRYACGVSLCFGTYFAYVSTGPVIFRESFGQPLERFGQATALVVAAFMLGNLAAARLAERVGAAPILRGSAALLVAGVSALVWAALLAPAEPAFLVAGMTLYGFAFAGVLAAGPLLVLDAAGDGPSGPAAALFGTLQLGAGALAGLISAAFYAGSSVSMASTMAVFAAIGAGLLLARPRSVAGAPVPRG